MIQIDRQSPIPLYRQVYTYFRSRIVEGNLREGDRLPSIRELQRWSGLAPGSIKRALGDLAADGLIVKIHGKGTFVSHHPAVRRFWGLAVPFHAEFYNQVILEMRRVAESQDIEIEHACDYDQWERQARIVEEWAWRGAEAIVVVPTRDEPSTLPRFRNVSRRSPVVLFDRTSIASQLPYVVQDYVYGVRAVIEALARRGARRVAYVRDPLWMAGNPVYRTMEETYFQVCAELGGAYRCVFDSPNALLDKDETDPAFDAVFCVNDQVACQAVGFLTERGLDVPGRVQVAGYNNAPVGRYFTPQITTTSPDLPAMCAQVAEIIARSQAGEPVKSLQYVSIPRLVERGSTRSGFAAPGAARPSGTVKRALPLRRG